MGLQLLRVEFTMVLEQLGLVLGAVLVMELGLGPVMVMGLGTIVGVGAVMELGISRLGRPRMGAVVGLSPRGIHSFWPTPHRHKKRLYRWHGLSAFRKCES